MLAMDQFKDVRGYTNYASRLPVGVVDVLKALGWVAFNETIGESMGVKIGPQTLVIEACDPALVERHFGSQGPNLTTNTENLIGV